MFVRTSVITTFGLAILLSGCGTTATTSDITGFLSSLTGSNVTTSTTIGEILNQLTVGDVINAYQAYVASQANSTGGHLPTSLTEDQLSQIEDLQAQLDAGAIDRATFQAGVLNIIGDTMPHPRGPRGGMMGGPFGMGDNAPAGDPLNLTNDQKTAAEAIFTQLKTDIDSLQAQAKEDILALLTDEQKTKLQELGLDTLRGLGRPGMRGPGMGPGMRGGHHGSMGVGVSNTGNQRYLDLLATKLTLTAEQKTSIQTILDNLQTAVKAAHDKADADFRALLTADQIAILDS